MKKKHENGWGNDKLDPAAFKALVREAVSLNRTS
jgi:hypothetical protein